MSDLRFVEVDPPPATVPERTPEEAEILRVFDTVADEALHFLQRARERDSAAAAPQIYVGPPSIDDIAGAIGAAFVAGIAACNAPPPTAPASDVPALLYLCNDHGEGIEAEDESDEDGPCASLTILLGQGFGQDSLTGPLSVDAARALHNWLGRWLAAKGSANG